MPSLFELECPVKHYDWGERLDGGGQPYISGLIGADPGSLPWAELWIGAHPSASSMLRDGGKSLAGAIAAGPLEMLGPALAGSGVESLPFLLKILCCTEPLSIQSHPDKATAGRLHKACPEQFPDANHKPEVLYALSDFKLMGGFRQPGDAIGELAAIPALSGWLSAAGGDHADMKSLGAFILSAPPELLAEMADGCMAAAMPDTPNARLFRELDARRHGDCGCLFAFLLNVFTLAPDQAVFIGPNIPHAYLRGRGIECMANSDNVIRAGLTSKHVDRKLLMDTLDFRPSSPESLTVGKGLAAGARNSFEYACGRDFRLQVAGGHGTEIRHKPGMPAVFIVLDGQAIATDARCSTCARRGSAWFVPASADITIALEGEGSRLAWADIS